jgi:gamma-D-glutamyl-L-lysine dipeptidyl-peptidase
MLNRPNHFLKELLSPMHFSQKASLVFLVAVFIIGACNAQQNDTSEADIKSLIDSLQAMYAPDKRVALWNVSIVKTSDKLKLIGELDKQEAHSAIQENFAAIYPNIEVNVKLLPEGGAKQAVTGLINNSVVNLRSNPRHSAELTTQALLGTPTKILKRENGWYLVQTPNKYIAWVDAPALVSINREELKQYKESKKIVYCKQYGFAYSEPNTNSQVVSDLALGCILPVSTVKAGFYRVQYPDKRGAWVKTDDVVDADKFFDRQIDEKELVKTAMKFLGVPYLWGGTSSKAVDCSGLTSVVYYMNGTILQRDASQQTMCGREITSNYEYRDLEPGDLLFFGRKASDTLPERVTHVAMYIGDSEFIHASGKVRINSIDSTRDNAVQGYVPRFVRAVRVKGAINSQGADQISENDLYKEIIKNAE